MVENPGENIGTSGSWSEVLDTIDAKHDKAHDRLRLDLEKASATCASLAATVERNYNFFNDQNAALRLRIQEVAIIAQRPIDGATIVWNTKSVIAVVVATLGIFGAWLDLKNSNRETQRKLEEFAGNQTKAITEMRQQRDADKKEAQDRLTQFLAQRLETAIAVNGSQTKGTKK